MLNPINDEQEELVSLLDKFMFSGKLFFLIEGVAGSGKTSIVSQYFFYNDMINNEDIKVLTPTHKSKLVIKKKMKELAMNSVSIECGTIQSFICLQKDISDTGKITFSANLKKKRERKLPKYLIIDECSMINKYCYSQLYEDAFKYQIKIVFLGDRHQLPPINERISKSFMITNKFMLKESVRNDGAILDLCSFIKDHIGENEILSKIENYSNVEGSNIIFTDDIGEYLDFIEEKSDGDFKILNWTNKECTKMNKVMRKKMFGSNTERFYKNEQLIVLKHFTDLQENLFYSNRELLIKNLSKTSFDRDFLISNMQIPQKYLGIIDNIKVWKLELDNCIEDGNILYYVLDSDKSKITTMLEKIRKDAIKYKKRNYRKEAKTTWELYYKVEDLFLPSIDYNYSITIHRSQASEWQYIFVNVNNVNLNKNIEERNKLLYVAFSRAQTKLVVYY